MKPNPDKPEPNRRIFEKFDDSQITLKPALGAAFSDSPKISCQNWQEIQPLVTKAQPERILLPGLKKRMRRSADQNVQPNGAMGR